MRLKSRASYGRMMPVQSPDSSGLNMEDGQEPGLGNPFPQTYGHNAARTLRLLAVARGQAQALQAQVNALILANGQLRKELAQATASTA